MAGKIRRNISGETYVFAALGDTREEKAVSMWNGLSAKRRLLPEMGR